jgi:hypothetical protein
MEVEFTRTGERRYKVTVFRDGLPAHETDGPGYDARMPHDLQHFIVERELGLKHGIFGFLAAGGETGGDEREPGRAASRRRRKGKHRDQRMMRRGERADDDASEAAAFLCWCEWLRRSGDLRAKELAEKIASTPARIADEARRLYGEQSVARVCACMDELGARWSRLAIGESFTVPWRPSERTIAMPGRGCLLPATHDH